MSFTEQLWSDVEDIYAQVLTHPFVTGLTDGSLPHESFRHYIVQDSHYLRGYSRALAACASKAPTDDETVMFATSATSAVAAEQGMHAALVDALGTTAEAAAKEPIAPSTQAYLSYLLAVAHGGSYGEAVATVLPCYWIYAKVGAELFERSSPDPLYARWIAMYGDEDFQSVVDAVLAVTDRIGETAGPAEIERMRRHFHTTSRYEWMFWDGAWRRETWPV